MSKHRHISEPTWTVWQKDLTVDPLHLEITLDELIADLTYFEGDERPDPRRPDIPAAA